MANATLPQQGEFSIGQARRIVHDLFQPNAAIYWTDFLLSMAVGGFCFAVVRRGLLAHRVAGWLEISSPAFPIIFNVLFFLVSCLAFFRAALFTHELVHLKPGAVPGFRVAWNLLCGIPFLMPSFLYHTHVHHHIRKHYGTQYDGEYLPLARGPARAIVWYLAQSFVIPLLAVVRFGILAPLGWMSPGLRRTIYQRASALIVDPSYVRPLPTVGELRIWRLQEAACFAYLTALGTLLLAGVLPWLWLVQAYATGACVILLNAVRTLGAHRYRLSGQQEATFLEQLLDSLNYPNNPWWNELWMPTGLRYHALHHLFPSLPYHQLGKAHRRLMEQLPADSPYRQTVSPSLFSSLRQLWCEARQAAGTAAAAHRTPAAT